MSETAKNPENLDFGGREGRDGEARWDVATPIPDMKTR